MPEDDTTQGAEGLEPLAALAKARDQFRFYEEQHRAKGTQEGQDKATVNAEMAAMCEAALRRTPTPPDRAEVMARGMGGVTREELGRKLCGYTSEGVYEEDKAFWDGEADAILTRLQSAREGEDALRADFTRAFPGGAIDDSMFSAVEDALDRADAPCRSPDDRRWLTLPERVAALSSPRSGEEERKLREALDAALMALPNGHPARLALQREYDALAARRPAGQGEEASA